MADARRQLLAGNRLLRDGRFGPAARMFGRARASFEAAGPKSDGRRLLDVAECVAGEAASLFELGRWSEAEGALRTALAMLPAAHAERVEAARVAERAASLHLELARGLLATGRLGEARGHLESAQARMRQLPPGELLGRTLCASGLCACLEGDFDLAFQLLERAGAILDDPARDAPPRERARLRLYRGNATVLLHRFDEGRAIFRDAIGIFEGLVAAGHLGQRLDLGKVFMNLGHLELGAGRLADGEQALRHSLAIYDAEIRRVHDRAYRARLRTSRAQVLMNLGYSLFLRGDLEAAQAAYRRSCGAYARIVKSSPHVRDGQARTWINQAHLAALRADGRRAARLYARGLEVFEHLLAEGQSDKMFDRANAALGLARCLLGAGRGEESAALFDTAMDQLATLTRRGQLQFAPTWLEAWQAQMSVLSKAPSGAHLDAVRASLAAALSRPPHRATGARAEAFHGLQAAIECIARWSPPTPSAASPEQSAAPLVARYLDYLYDWIAELLSQTEPAVLLRHAEEVDSAVGQLRAAASGHAQASRLLADWFLHTHGLRGQRSALAQGAETGVEQLRDLLQALRRIEDEMLGESGASAQVRSPAARSGFPFNGRPAATQRDDERWVRWRDLRARIDGLRNELVHAGLIPDASSLDARGVADRLMPASALVMVAPLERSRVLAIAVHRPDASGLFARHTVVEPSTRLAPFSFAVLNRLARQGLARGGRAEVLRRAPTCRGDVPDRARATDEELDGGDAFALELYEEVWRDALVPLLRSLAAQGVREVGLVPCGDLHLAPWSHLAQRAPPAESDFQIAVYPSCGAWARCALAGESGRAGAPRWALAAWAALDSPHPLPWVEIERLLSLRLWNDGAVEIAVLDCARPVADGVDTLLGLGHGGAPQDNPARAGLAFEGGGVLSAYDLAHVRTCRRVWMSACVLGRTDEAFGEPLGFLASCFDFKTEFAVGWLVEVPDSAACLMSLAVQFALRRAWGDAGQDAVSWTRVFASVRHAIMRGEWPEGFGGWLARALPAAAQTVAVELARPGRSAPAFALDSRLFAAPPEALRRVVPWMAVMGR